MQGMAEGSGTRSSLLWEVRRLLDEVENLPQVLLMENVPQVHSKQNMPHFQKWLDYLEQKGYSTFWQDMNAKNYGVAQSRNRTIAVSILGEYDFKFPKPYSLTKVMKDYLEDEVDEKYYLKSERAKELIDKLIIGGKTPKHTDKHLCVTEKGSPNNGSMGMQYLRLEKIGGVDVANTLTTHIPELSIQHCNLVIEVNENE